MTVNQDAQRLIDEATATLKQTTVGYAGHSAAWRANKTTKWWQGLDKLAQARALLDPVPPPVPPPTTQTGPVTITKGGVYTLNCKSAAISIPAVIVETNEPVTLQGRVEHPADGVLIQCGAGPRDITVNHLTAVGGKGRFLVAEEFKNARIVNCTIDKTAGIELIHGTGVVEIMRNLHVNVQRQADGVHFGNFAQLREVTRASVEIGWNEVRCAYNQSEAEDIISLFKSSDAVVHDNLLDGQSTPGNAYGTSSQNGITVDGDSAGPFPTNIGIYGNVILQTCGGVGITGFAVDCHSHDNLTLNDGWLYLPDGSRVKAANGYGGCSIWPGATRCSMRGDTVGYVNRDGNRNDFWLAGDVVGEVAALKLNTSFAGAVTKQVVDAARAAWKARAAAAGVTVGA